MNGRPPGAVALAIARRVLGRDDVRRIVATTVADLRFEHDERLAAGDAAGARRVRVAGCFTLARLIGALHVRARGRRLARSAPWLLIASVAASLVAIPALSGEAPRLATSQLSYVAVGVLVATLLATTSRRALRRATYPALGLVVAPLALVAGWGEAQEGARRWLAVGPLHVHVAALVAPAWVIAAAGLATSPRRLLASSGSVLALLVATRDLGAVGLYSAVVFAAGWPLPSARVRAALAATVALAVFAAALRRPDLSPERHVEGILGLVGASSRGSLFIAALGLAVVVAGAWLRARRADGGFPARASRAVATYLLLANVGAVASGGAIPFVSYGGSAVVGGLAMIGILASLGAARGGPPSGVLAR